MESNKKKSVVLKSMNVFSELFCIITLGLLVGWYYLLMIAIPILFYYSYHGNIIAITLQILLAILSTVPLSYTPWKEFMNSWVFALWREYFAFTYDVSHSKFDFQSKQQYMCLEFPHGIFPMGQFISASIIDKAFPGQMICGTGADIIFYFPIMRHLMAWLGTRPAKRKNIQKILAAGHHVAIIPGI
jgi:2-acylglycerol O-acyltransferase 2